MKGQLEPRHHPEDPATARPISREEWSFGQRVIDGLSQEPNGLLQAVVEDVDAQRAAAHR